MDAWGLRYGELVERRAERQPHRPAIVHEGHTLTYGDVGTRIGWFADVLRARGVSRGDRVLCVSENRPELLVAAYACSRIGAVFVPVNVASPVPELEFVLADATPVVVCAGAEARQVWSGDVPGLPPVVDLAAAPGPAGAPGEAVDVGPDDAAVICYTSGTTGRPKGVVLTHRALHWNSLNTLLGLDIVSGDVALVNTPLFHTAALNTLATNTLYKGATVVLQRGFDAGECLEAIETYGVTIMFAVPTMLALVEQAPGFDGERVRSLRWVLSGGAPLAPEAAARWQGRGVPVIASFGLSEAGPSVTFRRPDDVAGKAASSGPPAPLTGVRVVDRDGAQLPDGEVGEIVVTGPHVAPGYWNRPGATRETFRADGLHTGDRGYVDPDGDLVIVGRLKDTIITGGENVDPVEVEQAVLAHPAVAEAVVVGVPDPVWGERVAVVLVPAAGAVPDIEEIRGFLSERLAKYKVPRLFELWPGIPKTPVGKIRRADVRIRLTGADRA
ncbi:fatty-acyl-CoA synthase [Amycolatopsis bartoniae]|uniref:Acid--CoA ligase n=1 Tax=Amycolatopsis bartoniae TaxID=941986 RepID=A0A8H9IME2_9PSEU|nr:AMP-binding protein [Amycolatopsis bartoniae]MBB2938365.1 fatty-acyl-CoA synthase [Amycolatopsis bartoniae]TVT10230.1 long-chain fatty acid--CoA ligase [Amycolatopsis bartoniae]GHF34648.1 acid--CoA ligase [Amycolatopsis bartoniae]